MKRVIQRKAKQSIYDGSSELGESLKKQKRASQDIGNKTRTSAAMLGLALSMGASGSILSCHSKSAVAAETKAPIDISSVEGSLGDSDENSGASEDISQSEDLDEFSHVIREGETLWTISNRYNISSDSLIHANGFDEGVVLRVGQKVVVPLGSSQATAEQVSEDEASSSFDQLADSTEPSSENLAQLQIENAASSTIDDHISSYKAVSKKVEVLPEQPPKEFQVSEANSLSDVSSSTDQSNFVSPASTPVSEVVIASEKGSGADVQVVDEPVAVVEHVAFSEIEEVSAASQAFDADMTVPTTHQIRVGETLADIARRYNISTQQLAEVNRIRNPNRIFAGRILSLPPGSVLSVVSDVDVPIDSIVPASFDSEIQVNDSEVERVVSLPLASELEARDSLETVDFVSPESIESVDGSFYVDRLLGEIEKISEGYRTFDDIQSEEVSVESQEVEVVPSKPDEVAYVPGVVSEPRSLTVVDDRQVIPSNGDENIAPASQETDTQSSDNFSISTEEVSPELVASAPLGAENYVPLNQPVTGRMVSPDLPPLTGPENYLPSSSSSFNGYKYPAQGTLTSGYGWRWGRMHRGIDVAAPIGTPIVAAAPGVIEYSGWNSGGYGNMVEVRHPDGSMTRYAHNSRNLVRVGQQVAQGEQIAEMGSTGYSTGPHVHFEIHMPEQGTVNPVAYLSQ